MKSTTSTLERISYTLTPREVAEAIKEAVIDEAGQVLNADTTVTLTADGGAVVATEFLDDATEEKL